MVFGLGKSNKKKKEAAASAAAAETANKKTTTASRASTSASTSGTHGTVTPPANSTAAKAAASTTSSNRATPLASSYNSSSSSSKPAPAAASFTAMPLKSSLKKSTLTSSTSSTPRTNNYANNTPNTNTATNSHVVTPPTSPTYGANVRPSTTSTRSGPIDVDEIPRSKGIHNTVITAANSSHDTDSTLKTSTTARHQNHNTNSNSNSNSKPPPYPTTTSTSTTSSSNNHPQKKRLVVDTVPSDLEDKEARKNKKMGRDKDKDKENSNKDDTYSTANAMQNSSSSSMQLLTKTTTTTTTLMHHQQHHHHQTATRSRSSSPTKNNSTIDNNNNRNNDYNDLENTSLLRQQQQRPLSLHHFLTSNSSFQSNGGGSFSISNNSNNNNNNSSRDDLSLASGVSNASSRISLHIDHFLAQMAMADNAQLEQLAVEEMKHNQVLPQKIKKLSSQIHVLNEERDVLVGLIEQLQELVEQDKERKRLAKLKKKKLKKEKKERKKRKRRALQKKREAEKAKEAARAEMDAEAAAKETEPSTTTTIATSGDPGPALITPEKTSPENSDDETYLDEDDDEVLELEGVKDKGENCIKDESATGEEEPWSPEYKVAAERNQKPDITFTSSVDDQEEEEEDDEFAKLWNSSYNCVEGGGDANDTNDTDDKEVNVSDNNRRATVKRGNMSSNKDEAEEVAKPKVLFDVGDPLSDPLFDDFYNENKPGSDDNKDATDVDEDSTGAAIPEERKKSHGLPNRNKSFEAKALETQEVNLEVSEGDTDKDNVVKTEDTSLWDKRRQRSGRFANFQETDMYLPDHMPGSRGPSPTPSMEKEAINFSSEDDSDSDSSDSDDSSAADDDVVVMEDDHDAVPSGSHLLAKQLMSRLKQEEKLKEQEKLQRQLFELHSNSRHRMKDGSGLSSSYHNSYTGTSGFSMSSGRQDGLAGHRSASMSNVYTARGPGQSVMGGNYTSSSLRTTSNAGKVTSLLGNYRQDSYLSIGASFANEDSFSKLQNSFTANGQMNTNVSDEVNDLRQELYQCIQELDQLKEERQFHEAKVKELLCVLERRFDIYEEEEEEEEDTEVGNTIQKAIDVEECEEGNLAGKKRKRMKSFLLQKVSQCADLTAEVQVLKEQVSAKQAKLEELQESAVVNSNQSCKNGKDDTAKKEEESMTKPASLVNTISISADLTKDQIEKQLLEKSVECIDLQEQIKELKKQLQEKDEAYQEVHRELFTANLALGVEVDRKATAQEALDEKCHDYDLLKEEYDKIKEAMDEYNEEKEVLDEELMEKSARLDEMDKSYRDDITLYRSQVEEKDSEIAEMKKELSELREKTKKLEDHQHEVEDKATTNENLVEELRKALDVENDLKQELEKKCASVEKEREELEDDLGRVRRENEINKALIKKDREASADGSGGGGRPSIEIQQEVENLMAHNADMSRDLRTIRETEAALLSERERLVANATNMSIMLADSRAKVDFLQMQLEEYKNNAPMTNSEHGFSLSRSAHGFNSSPGRKAGEFRNFLSNSSSKIGNQLNNMSGSQLLGDSSERSVGGHGGSVREKNTRFRNFLSKRMGSQNRDEPSGADSAAGGD